MIPGQEVHVAGPVWVVPGEGGGHFPRCHCVYIDDGGGVLIDTGAGDRVLADLTRRRPVEVVLNTHTHIDHVFGNYLFGDRDILVPEMMAHSAGDLVKLSRRFVPPEMSSLWRRVILDCTTWRDQPPTGTFGPSQVFKFGTTRVETVFAPGHLADHCMFLLPDHQILISADLDLTPFGPWYGNPESDLDLIRRSIDQAVALRPKIVVSSHREPVTQDIAAEFARFAAVIDRREAALLDYLEQERTWDQVLDQRLVYGPAIPFTPQIVRFFEDRMLSQHLVELRRRGLVRATERGFIRV